ncbi:hypothetical protein ACHAO9_010977 [Fusarium lateritium]
MAPNNEHNIKAGLDTVTQDEHDEVTAVLESLADPQAASGSVGVMSNTGDSDDVVSPDNVFYINVGPIKDNLPEKWLNKLKSMTYNTDLNNGFFSYRANQTLKDAIARQAISSKDDVKQKNYLAKVINHLYQNAPWISTTAINTQDKQFTVEKNAFHKALISHFTEGLKLPASILDKLEGFLTNVKNTINNSSTTSDITAFYIFITIFVKDDVLQDWRPYVRTISFKPSQKLSTYTKKKGDDSSGVNVDIDFKYILMDGSFNNSLFESSAKDSIEVSQNKAGRDFAKDTKPLDVEVD